ncbi:MAG TPA: hypothetical protein VJ302_14040, partial [Blastocatellia bacterium]|nr:hypothetical protein [Blastocatellia bacterium]
RLKRILDDSALKSVHESARRLLGFVDYRLDPERRVRELAQAVLRKSSGKTIRQDVIDYTRLLDQYEDVDRKVTAPASARQDDLTDWLFTFQTRSDEALNHSLQRWTETSSSWWLIAALARIDLKHPQATALLEAAAAVPPGSPPFATAVYHWLRLTIEAGRPEAARDKLDRLLVPGTPLPVSASNQLLVMRTRLARTPEEFFKFAQRGPASVTYNGDDQELPIEETETDLDADLKPFVKGRVSFGEDAVKVMNEALPLTLIKNAAMDAALPAHLRRLLAIAGWTRAVLLDDDETARTLAPVLLTLLPVMKKPLDAYLAADNATERKDAALYLILKFPGLRPHVDAGLARLTPLERADNYRDNWWCNYRGSVTGVRPEPAGREQPAFLSAEQQSAAAAERQKLEALEIGPNDLCIRAVEWAKRSPADPRVPEALHRAVTATRLGCRNKQTRRYSKLAFDTLHKQYPNSSWAKQTKYYFGEE